LRTLCPEDVFGISKRRFARMKIVDAASVRVADFTALPMILDMIVPTAQTLNIPILSLLQNIFMKSGLDVKLL
jgi:hypothetical protein